MKIFDGNRESKILFNPKLTDKKQLFYIQQLKEAPFENHFWLSTSGTSSKNGIMKWVALSKEAIEISAKAVNEHLSITSKDRWIHPLPNFHIGGLQIWARAEVSNSEVIDYKKDNEKWDPIKFHSLCLKTNANFSSLVPAQVYDLIKANVKAPNSLKAIIVGGGALNEHLYVNARKLGWNLLPSYGMSECASQVATASLKSLNELTFPQLEILSHIESIEVNENNLCKIKSKSLLTSYAIISENNMTFVDPKNEGYFQTEDIIELNFPYVRPICRSNEMIKIGGESVNLSELNLILQIIQYRLNNDQEFILIPHPHDRLGTAVHLVTNTKNSSLISQIVNEFNHETLPFENIREVHYLKEIPFTELKKVNLKKILEMVSSS